MGGCLWDDNDYYAGDDDGDSLAKGEDVADSADKYEKTVIADNREQDDGDTLLADNGDKDHGADAKDTSKDEVHVATNAGSRGDHDDDAMTASCATGESMKCGEVSLLVSDFFCLCILISFYTKCICI